ncbi:MAG: RNA polymerase sigma factor [Pseudomonadota bacterium]|nr:RNA polymerase sigma factor [Pseudomonadota bacterium]
MPIKKLEKELTDEVLMTLYCKGDNNAFDTLYSRHSQRVFGYLQKKAPLLSTSDLLQDTFFKLHRSRDQYNSQYPFLPWLFTIAKNTLLDSARKTSLENKRFLSREDFENISAPIAIEGPSITLVAATSSLPEMQKSAVVLRYLEEWSFEDIATKLKTSPENARQLASRGVKALRNLFRNKEESSEF